MLYIRFMLYVRLQKNITTYRSTTRALQQGGEVQEVSGVPDVVQKRDCFLACFVILFLDILLNVRTYNNNKRSGKLCKTLLKKTRTKKHQAVLFSVNAWIGTRAMFPMISLLFLSCSKFSIRDCNMSDV